MPRQKKQHPNHRNANPPEEPVPEFVEELVEEQLVIDPPKISNFDAIQKYAWIVAIIFSVAALGLSAYNLKLLRQNKEVATAAAATTNVAPVAPVSIVDIKKFTSELTGSEPVLGNPNAKQTIYEFADFQCPFCKMFFDQRFPQIKKDYIDTGKVKLVFINLAFLGQESKAAAQAAWCASDQGQFWPYHDQLYENQKGENTGGFSTANLKALASKLNLNMSQFTKCVASNKYQKAVEDQLQLAYKYGAKSTPTFFINNKVIVGVQPIEAFQQVLSN